MDGSKSGSSVSGRFHRTGPSVFGWFHRMGLYMSDYMENHACNGMYIRCQHSISQVSQQGSYAISFRLQAFERLLTFFNSYYNCLSMIRSYNFLFAFFFFCSRGSSSHTRRSRVRVACRHPSEKIKIMTTDVQVIDTIS